MKKFIKLFIWAAGLLLALAIIAVAVFAFLFDPNNMRDDITRIVEKETGRQLIIEGELSLTFFPWLGFEAGRTTLSNPDGFSDKLMATVESASASVKLMPLLKRQMELSKVKFDGVDLKLEILADGSDNWTDLIGSSEPAPEDDSAGAFAAEGVNGIQLSNTRISYTDAQTGDVYSVSKLALETGKVMPGKPFSLDASGDVVSVGDEIAGPASIKAEVQFGDNDIIYLRKADMEIDATGNTIPGEQMLLKVQSPMLEVHPTKITMETPQIQFDGTGSGDPWTTFKGQGSGQSMAMALEEDTITISTPKIQMKGTSTDDLWTTLDGKLDGQSLLLKIEQDKKIITISAPVIEMAGTATGDSWTTLEGTGNGQSLVVQIEEETDTVTITTPVMQLTGTGPGDPWSAMKGTVKGQSLKLVNYDRVDIPAMQVSGRMSGPDFPGGFVDMTMTSERMQGSIDHENFAFDVARADLLDVSVFSKKIKASSVVEAPVIEAAIQVSKFSPSKLMKNLGIEEMVTADKTALTAATISGDAYYGPEWMGISNMVGTVDQTAVSGSVKIMTSGEARFNIVADTINLDRYREPAETTAGTSGEATAVADIELPIQDLRELALDGTLKVGKMELVGLHSSDVAFTIRAAGGDIRIKPAQAKLYGGTYTGDIHLDAKGKVPVLSLNERFDDVQFGPFTEDLLGRKRLTGTLSGRMTIVGSGTTSNQITASSNGDAVFKFVDGAYMGVDIWHKVRSARAVLKREGQPTEPASDRTRFGDLSGTAKIVNGVLRSDDLSAVMPFMKVRGSGNLVLLTQEIDFKFVGEVFDRPELNASDNELVGFPLPIKMTGTTAAPDIGVDMGGLLAALAKRKLLDKIGLGARATTDPNADPNAPAPTPADKVQDVRQQAEDKIKDKLKGLFGGSKDKKDTDTGTDGGG